MAKTFFFLSNIYVLPDIRSDIYFEIVGPTAFLSVRTDGPTVFGKSDGRTRKKSLFNTSDCLIEVTLKGMFHCTLLSIKYENYFLQKPLLADCKPLPPKATPFPRPDFKCTEIVKYY